MLPGLYTNELQNSSNTAITQLSYDTAMKKALLK